MRPSRGIGRGGVWREEAGRVGGVNGFLASLEMSGEQLADRAISKLGRINAMHIRRPRLMEEEEWASAPAAAQHLTKHLLYVDDASSLSVEGGCARARQVAAEAGALGLVVVDYLTYIDLPRKENQEQGIQHITRSLKRLAKELRVPVILLSQLNRDGDDEPSLKHLRGSGAIEQDADVVILLHRPDKTNRRVFSSPEDFLIVIASEQVGGRDVLAFHDVHAYGPIALWALELRVVHTWRDAMSCILHLIWGPTCSGKTEVAVALAEQTGWPVIALDRIQCCPEMSTCSGRPLPAELRATRRIYLTSRAVREGIIAADEAHALLVDLVDRHSAVGGVILEGGSISLINRMILDPYWANDWQWRSHRLLLGERADFLDRALRRGEKMLRTGMGRPSLLEELVALWPDPALRPTIEDVDGYRYAIRFARQWNVPVGQLLSIGDEMKQRLIHGIAEEYLGHAQWQERDLLTLPANWQAQDVSMGGSKSGLHHRL
ncbi:isopentenyl transferase family protein [Xanthomonas oryzae]|uniref:isopentenyl transferase family protein n=1 Tax=Xanthomonas oryzae TaxID=347 RepID=UPI003467597F